MKYQVGDTVLLLHSKEEGTVKEIMNENMVLVDVDGVEFPVFTDQIDFPYFHRFSQQSQKKKESEPDRKVYIDQIKKEELFLQENIQETGMWLRMFPVYDSQTYEDAISHYKIYLINTLNEGFHFEYNIRYRDNHDFVFTNTIQKQDEFYLNNIDQEELNDITRFQFIFSPVIPDKNRKESLTIPLRIQAKKLFRKIEEMHAKNEPAISFSLFENYPDKPPIPYYPLPENKLHTAKPLSSDSPQSIVDLHLEKITDAPVNLSNHEKLLLQLHQFEKYYDLAVAHTQPKLIVIHGIGSGRLRDEIHEILHHKKEVSYFVNQYHPDFGFGATEIYFHY